MPYPSEHAARVKDPALFEDDSFRRKNIAPGVDIIIGKLKDEESMTTQAYRFDAEKFTPEQAKKWLKDNNVEYISFEPAEKKDKVEGHIFIHGVITSYEDNRASDYGEVNLKDVNNQLTNNKEADTLIVHINSMGGDVYEGYAIHDILRASGKKIITQAEGLVASIATVIYLAGDERYITENSELMIHNPWGFAEGDSSQVQKYADQLKKEENKLAEFYASKTGSTAEEMLALMKDETYLTADIAIEKKFATQKTEQIKAVALLNYNKNMTDAELNAKIEEKTEGVFSKITALFKKHGVIKALVLKTGDGQNLDFGEEIQEASQIVVGTAATVEGKPAEGDYVMPDGTTLVFKAGKVTEIKPKPVEDVEKKELQAKLTKATAELSEAHEALKAVQKEMTEFKAQITSDIKGFKPSAPAEPAPSDIRKPYKTKE